MTNAETPIKTAAEAVRQLSVASSVIGNLPALPGSNGSVLLIDDDEAMRIEKAIDDSIACIDAELERLRAQVAQTDTERAAWKRWCEEAEAQDTFAEIERLRAQNRQVAQQIVDNDRAGVVKWATGLVTSLDDQMHVERLAAPAQQADPLDLRDDVIATLRHELAQERALCDERGSKLDELYAQQDAAQQAEPVAVECWHGERKVTVYPGENVLRIWGASMASEMSEEPFSLKVVQDAMDWLYQPAHHPAQGVGLTDERIDKMLDELDDAALNFGDDLPGLALNSRGRERSRAIARAALAQAPAAEPQWQPIETAPKDRNVLMFDADERKVGEAFFDHAESDCWVWENGMLVVEPAGWQPLPAGPAA